METSKLIVTIFISMIFNISSAVHLLPPLPFDPFPLPSLPPALKPTPQPAPPTPNQTPQPPPPSPKQASQPPPPAPNPASQPPPPAPKPTPQPAPPTPNPTPRSPPPSPKPASRPPPPAPKPKPRPPPPTHPSPPGNSSSKNCPIDTMKLGVCVDLLGHLIHIKIGDPAINLCCPMLGGLLGMEAALCMCSTLTIKMMNLTLFMPVALELIATCGKHPPPGYACDLSSRTNASAPFAT